MATKVCKLCGVEKPIEEFFKNKKRADGHSTRCIECYEKLIRYYEDTPPEQLPKKKCTKCRELKPVSEYYRDMRADDGLKPSCKSCELKLGKTYYHSNREEIRNRYRERYQETIEYQQKRADEYRLKNKDRINETKRLYCKNNPDRMKEKSRRYKEKYPYRQKEYYYKNQDRLKAYCKKYRETNGDWLRAHMRAWFKTPAGRTATMKSRHIRRTREMKTECNLTHEQWEKILGSQHNKCAMCGKRFCKSRPPTQDHIIPVSKGGGLTFENVQALCRSCNSKKSNSINLSLIVSYGVYAIPNNTNSCF